MKCRWNGSSLPQVNPWDTIYDLAFNSHVWVKKNIDEVGEKRRPCAESPDLRNDPRIIIPPPAAPNIAMPAHVLHLDIDINPKQIEGMMDSGDEGLIIFRLQLCPVPTEPSCCFIGSNEGSHKFSHNGMNTMIKYRYFRKRKEKDYILPEM